MAEPAIKAAGALLWRPGPDGAGPLLGLVHRPSHADWTLPKGKLEPGEHVVAAAVREVAEETGYRVALGRPLPTRRYLVEGRRKQVRYWVAKGGELASNSFVPGPEVDELAWLPLTEARERLSYAHDAELVGAFDKEPAETVPLVVLRHAKAVKRSAWKGTIDNARPLATVGVGQGRRLVPLMAAYGIRRVHTSDATRCRDTVAGYAASRDLPLIDEPLMSEDGHEHAPKAARGRAVELLHEPEPLVVCSHRPVLPDLLRELLASARGRPARPLAPGAFLVLHRELAADGAVRVVAVERHRP
jgi:8-oxo-(d)GTP phosphatase